MLIRYSSWLFNFLCYLLGRIVLELPCTHLLSAEQLCQLQGLGVGEQEALQSHGLDGGRLGGYQVTQLLRLAALIPSRGSF